MHAHMCMHTHMCTHAHTHTRMHSHTHTCMHTHESTGMHTCTCACMHTHSLTHAHTHAHMHACVHVCTHAYTHIRTSTPDMHVYMSSLKDARCLCFESQVTVKTTLCVVTPNMKVGEYVHQELIEIIQARCTFLYTSTHPHLVCQHVREIS